MISVSEFAGARIRQATWCHPWQLSQQRKQALRRDVRAGNADGRVRRGAQVQIDHRNGTVHFGGQQLESERLRDHVAQLARRLARALQAVAPARTPDKQARKAKARRLLASLERPREPHTPVVVPVGWLMLPACMLRCRPCLPCAGGGTASTASPGIQEYP